MLTTEAEPTTSRNAREKTYFALTAVGKDRPGIVAAVSRVLFEQGCNIEDSSNTLLGGEFAMILLVTAGADVTVDRLESALADATRDLGLSIGLSSISADQLSRSAMELTAPYMVSVYGSDKAGIVYRISRYLADAGVNILDLNTKVIRKGETPVYVMMIEVEVPTGMDAGRLTLELEGIGADLGVTVNVRPVEVAEL